MQQLDIWKYYINRNYITLLFYQYSNVISS